MTVFPSCFFQSLRKVSYDGNCRLVVTEVAGVVELGDVFLVGLPGAHFDKWSIGVGHVHEQEQIALVTVGGAAVFLTDLDGEEIFFLVFLTDWGEVGD